MKKIVFFFLTAISYLGIAQTVLPLDSSTNKVTYYEVVTVDSVLRKGILLMNAEKWAEKHLKIEEIKADSHKIICTGVLIMSEYKGVLEKTTGKFTYDCIMEVKDGRYRYLFSNFVYHKLNTDKNGRQTYMHKKKIEEPKAPGWTRLWNKHKASLDIRVRALITDLKEKMNVNPYVPAIEKKIKEKGDW